jgi:hypothetical protein
MTPYPAVQNGKAITGDEYFVSMSARKKCEVGLACEKLR